MESKIFWVILLVPLLLALSYGVTLFIYWLITLCFGISWTLLHGTGVWLTLLLIGGGINGGSIVKFENKY